MPTTRLHLICILILTVIGLSGPLRLLFPHASLTQLSTLSGLAPLQSVFNSPKPAGQEYDLAAAEFRCIFRDGSIKTVRYDAQFYRAMNLPHRLYAPLCFIVLHPKYLELFPHYIKQEFCKPEGHLRQASGCTGDLLEIQVRFQDFDNSSPPEIKVLCDG